MRDRVTRLLDAYFNRPHEEYLLMLSSIKKSGGLSEEEVRTIQSRIPHVHASAIVRHAMLASAQVSTM